MHATAIRNLDDGFEVYFHESCIVRQINGEWQINFQNWPTATTRRRMNHFIPKRFFVFQREWAQCLLDRETDKIQHLPIKEWVTLPND